MSEDEDEDDHRSCFICCYDYGAKELIVPMNLSCCGNHICYSCAENHRAAKVGELVGKSKQIRCPSCNESFHCITGVPWSVSRAHICLLGIKKKVQEDLKVIRKAEDARKSTPTIISAPRIGTRRSARQLQLEDDAASGDNSPSSVQITPASASTDYTHERERAEDECESDDESRFATDDLSIEESLDGEDEAPTTRKRTRSDSSSEEFDYEANGDVDQWLGIISKKNIKVCRVRISMKDCVNKVDKYGRRCAEWCLRKGCITASALMLTALPDNVQATGGGGCKDFIRNLPHKELLKVCKKSREYDYSKGKNYIHTFRSFVEMKPGDVVVMQIKGGAKRDSLPPNELAFGVIEDDSLYLRKKDEVRDNEDHPWDFKKDGEDVSVYSNGIMLRKVKWHRKGILCDVRGRKQADWLAESGPKWLAEIGSKNEHLLLEAIEKMSSREFFDNTIGIASDPDEHFLQDSSEIENL